MHVPLKPSLAHVYLKVSPPVFTHFQVGMQTNCSLSALVVLDTLFAWGILSDAWF